MTNHDGFRTEETKDKALEGLRKNLTTEELQRVQEQRKFDAIEKDTITYQIALHLDSLKKDCRSKKTAIEKYLWNVENIANSMKRCELQLAEDNIYEKLPENDIVMNEQELQTYIKHQGWLLQGEVRALAPAFADLRSLVGHKDLLGNDVLTLEEFDAYFKDVEKRLNDLGHSIFD